MHAAQSFLLFNASFAGWVVYLLIHRRRLVYLQAVIKLLIAQYEDQLSTKYTAGSTHGRTQVRDLKALNMLSFHSVCCKGGREIVLNQFLTLYRSLNEINLKGIILH